VVFVTSPIVDNGTRPFDGLATDRAGLLGVGFPLIGPFELSVRKALIFPTVEKAWPEPNAAYP